MAQLETETQSLAIPNHPEQLAILSALTAACEDPCVSGENNKEASSLHPRCSHKHDRNLKVKSLSILKSESMSQLELEPDWEEQPKGRPSLDETSPPFVHGEECIQHVETGCGGGGQVWPQRLAAMQPEKLSLQETLQGDPGDPPIILLSPPRSKQEQEGEQQVVSSTVSKNLIGRSSMVGSAMRAGKLLGLKVPKLSRRKLVTTDDYQTGSPKPGDADSQVSNSSTVSSPNMTRRKILPSWLHISRHSDGATSPHSSGAYDADVEQVEAVGDVNQAIFVPPYQSVTAMGSDSRREGLLRSPHRKVVPESMQLQAIVDPISDGDGSAVTHHPGVHSPTTDKQIPPRADNHQEDKVGGSSSEMARFPDMATDASHSWLPLPANGPRRHDVVMSARAAVAKAALKQQQQQVEEQYQQQQQQQQVDDEGSKGEEIRGEQLPQPQQQQKQQQQPELFLQRPSAIKTARKARMRRSASKSVDFDARHVSFAEDELAGQQQQQEQQQQVQQVLSKVKSKRRVRFEGRVGSSMDAEFTGLVPELLRDGSTGSEDHQQEAGEKEEEDKFLVASGHEQQELGNLSRHRGQCWQEGGDKREQQRRGEHAGASAEARTRSGKGKAERKPHGKCTGSVDFCVNSVSFKYEGDIITAPLLYLRGQPEHQHHLDGKQQQQQEVLQTLQSPSHGVTSKPPRRRIANCRSLDMDAIKKDTGAWSQLQRHLQQQGREGQAVQQRQAMQQRPEEVVTSDQPSQHHHPQQCQQALPGAGTAQGGRGLQATQRPPSWGSVDFDGGFSAPVEGLPQQKGDYEMAVRQLAECSSNPVDRTPKLVFPISPHTPVHLSRFSPLSQVVTASIGSASAVTPDPFPKSFSLHSHPASSLPPLSPRSPHAQPFPSSSSLNVLFASAPLSPSSPFSSSSTPSGSASIHSHSSHTLSSTLASPISSQPVIHVSPLPSPRSSSPVHRPFPQPHSIAAVADPWGNEPPRDSLYSPSSQCDSPQSTTAISTVTATTGGASSARRHRRRSFEDPINLHQQHAGDLGSIPSGAIPPGAWVRDSLRVERGPSSIDRILGSNSNIMKGGGPSSFDRILGSNGGSSTAGGGAPSAFDRMMLSKHSAAGGGTGRAAAESGRRQAAVPRRVGAKSDCKMPCLPGDGAKHSSGRHMVGDYEVEGMTAGQLTSLLEARAEVRAALRAGERAEGEALRRRARRDARAEEAAMHAAREENVRARSPSRPEERVKGGVMECISLGGEGERRMDSPQPSHMLLQKRHAEAAAGAAEGAVAVAAASRASEKSDSGAAGNSYEQQKDHNEWQQQQQQQQQHEMRLQHPVECGLNAAGQKQANLGAAFGPGSVHAEGMKLLGKGARLKDHVLQQRYEDVGSRYVMHRKELGSGQYGVIRKCMDMETGTVYACKTISKDKIRNDMEVDDIRKEVQLLRLLSPHPTTVELKDTFEDEDNVHLVMELCRGGDLFDRLAKRRMLSEPVGARLCKALAEALDHCHRHRCVHRDIKPENILMVDKTSDTEIKLVDFGVATFFKPGKMLTDVIGTPEYMAPEQIMGCYGPEVDVWGAGVVMYLAMCGVPPFWASSRDAVKEKILTKELNFKAPRWRALSPACKDLIASMLQKSPRKRATVQDILAHPWIQRYSSDSS